MIEIAMIGTGALQPLPGRALACAAVTMNGRTLLLDCGEGTQSAARAAGVSLMKIDAIALTHYHGDHIFGLPGLLQSMGMAGRTEPVYVFGPEGLEEAMKPFEMLCPYLPFEWRRAEIPGEGLRLNELLPDWPAETVLRTFATEHRVPSQGYRIDRQRAGKFNPQRARELGVPVQEWKRLQHGDSVQLGDSVITPDQVMGEARKGLSVAFTGDTSFSESVAEAVKDADLLICEGTYGENEQAETAAEHGHMTFSQAAELAARAGVQSLWLTHYSPMVTDPQEYAANAAAIFGNTVCATDGLRTRLNYGGE